jgi:peroxiredoxin Q/BCP
MKNNQPSKLQLTSLFAGLWTLLVVLAPATALAASNLKVGDQAPAFTLKDQNGKEINLADRKGKGWTVLFFYPKADTPGCTKQACAFRDSIKIIQAKNAEIYGVSVNTVDEQKKFSAKHNINFPLLCDSTAEVAEKYGVKMPVVGIAKRWTFVIDPLLVIRNIDKDVDPAMDAKKTAKLLDTLQTATKP